MIDSHGAGRATEPAGSPEGYERRRLAAIPGSPRGSSGESQIEPVSLKARAGTTSFGLLAARAAVLERAPYVLSKLTAEIAGRAIARLSVSPPTLAPG